MRIFSLFILFSLLGCDRNRIFEKHVDLKGSWPLQSSQLFEFDIIDSEIPYHITGMVRNKNSYAFNNLYIKFELFHEDSLIKTNLTEVILFEPKTGKPLGSGMGSTFDRNFDFVKSHTFETSGHYKIKLTQFMRLDTLKDIDRIGVRVAAVIQP
jgi:gliding motility-associated lipoprotein GldH